MYKPYLVNGARCLQRCRARSRVWRQWVGACDPSLRARGPHTASQTQQTPHPSSSGPHAASRQGSQSPLLSRLLPFPSERTTQKTTNKKEQSKQKTEIQRKKKTGNGGIEPQATTGKQNKKQKKTLVPIAQKVHRSVDVFPINSIQFKNGSIKNQDF